MNSVNAGNNVKNVKNVKEEKCVPLLTFFTLLTSFAFFTTLAKAQFEVEIGSARTAGMAGTSVAFVNDASALWLNPAGLAWLRRAEIQTSYGRLHVGLSDGSVLNQSVIGGVHPVDAESAVGMWWSSFTLLDAYQEEVFGGGYGRQISPWLSMGASVKILTKRYAEDAYTVGDPVFVRSGFSATAVSSDFGLLCPLSPHYLLGLSVKDWIQPNLGLGETDRVPVTVRGGFAYRHAEVTAAVEGGVRGADWHLRVGSEKWWADRTIALRGGLEWGSRESRNLSVGASLRSPTWQMDYAWVYSMGSLKGLSGTHRVSFGVQFGPPSAEEAETHDLLPLKSIEGQIERLRSALEDAEARYRVSLEEARKMREGQKLEYDGRVNALVVEMRGLREKIQELETRRVDSPRPPAPVVERPVRPKSYLVKEGDTLMSVAEKFYGNADAWKKIYEANADRIERGTLVSGQELILP